MARQKKINPESLAIKDNNTPTRYYWCVWCGKYGDFKQLRIRNLKCENCGYSDLCDLDKEEYIKGAKQRGLL